MSDPGSGGVRYSEALERQISLMRYWRSEGGHRQAREVCRQRMEYLGSAPSPMHFIGGVLYNLERAETYYVDAQIGQFARGASKQLPAGARLHREVIPTGVGFVWFAQPVEIGVLPTGLWENRCGRTYRLRAMHWQEQVVKNTIPTEEDQINSVAIYTYAECACGDVHPMGELDWPFVDAWDSWTASHEDPDFSATMEHERRFILTLFEFMNQRILVSTTQRAERATRRRLEKDGWEHEPLIQVVQLRRHQPSTNGTTQHEPVAWSHQWVVSGHWHKFWIGKCGEQTLQPRWLMPYVKGPENKPLKPPRAKVFALVR